MTEERRIQLVAEVDATGARAGLNEISREAGTMSAAVGRNAQQAEAAVAGIGSGAGRSAGQIEAAGRNLIGSIQRQTAAMEAGSRTGAAYYEVLARQRGVDPAILAPYLAQLRAVEQTQARTNAAVAGAAAPLRQVGVSAAQTAAALRGVPAQFTDIVTSLQGGQAPLTVLFQQGGQLRDMFGSAGGAARALGGFVLGLVTPFTVAAGAAVGLAYAHHLGAEEAKAYTRSLILTNNAAGATADSMAEAARHIGQISGGQGAAAAALVSLTESGKVPAENLQRFASVAVQAQQVIGRSVADTVADFTALGKAPLTALDQINEKYHFITASTYAQVKALLDQGRAAEAADVAQKAYADGIDKQRQKVLDSLSDWERGWIRIKKAAGGALDSVLDFGRGATNFEKINSLLQVRDTIESQLSTARQTNDSKAIASLERQLNLNKGQINAVRSKTDGEKAAAAAAAKGVELEEAKTKWLKDGDQYLSRAAQLQRDIIKAQNEGKAAGASQAEIDKRVSDVRKKYADIFNDGIDSNIEALKRRAAVEDVLTQRIIARINAARSVGGNTEEDVINQTADAEDKAFARKRANLVKELELTKGKQNSLKDQQGLAGEIAVLDAQRVSAQIKREQDLLALAFQRAQASRLLFNAGINQAIEERNAIGEQIKAQLDYNEEIGRSATEVLFLRNARLLNIASQKDETAAALEQFEANSPLAAQYRDQAAGLRSLARAQEDGFIKQRDPYVGLAASLKRYGDEASDVGTQIGGALTSAFRGAEDAFANFVTTGKLSFSSLATSIVADLARIAAKRAIAGLAESAFGSLFGGSTGSTGGSIVGALAGARAAGGPVTGGSSYLVGEKGPEIFTPSASGKIIANHAIGGAGGGDINISTNVQVSNGSADSRTSGDSSAQGRALADLVNNQVKAVLARETRQGGILWNMKAGRA